MELSYKVHDIIRSGYRMYILGVIHIVNELQEIPKRYAAQNIDLVLVRFGGEFAGSVSCP